MESATDVTLIDSIGPTLEVGKVCDITFRLKFVETVVLSISFSWLNVLTSNFVG